MINPYTKEFKILRQVINDLSLIDLNSIHSIKVEKVLNKAQYVVITYKAKSPKHLSWLCYKFKNEEYLYNTFVFKDMLIVRLEMSMAAEALYGKYELDEDFFGAKEEIEFWEKINPSAKKPKGFYYSLGSLIPIILFSRY